MHLTDEMREERIEGVVSFVGVDGSGSFGILAGRERFVTTLSLGLCSFRTRDGVRHYLASPGGALLYSDALLRIATRHYYRDDNFESVAQHLRVEIAEEESNLQAMRELLHRVDQELLRHFLASPYVGELRG
jgi:F-type H+-transporting ATPase subunit epsilon